MVTAVLLDAHGTLVELEPPAPRLQAVLRERFDLSIELDLAAAALRAEITYYRAHMNEGRDAAGVAVLRDRCAAVLRDALGVPGLPSGAPMTEVLLGSLVFRPFPEVVEVLRGLRGAGLRCVVASNWDASLEDTLTALGLRAELDGVVTSAQCGAPKPAAAVFLTALQRAGAGAGEAIHVGDTVAEDVDGARAVGIEPVLLRRDGGDGPPGVTTIRTLLDLPGLRAGETRPAAVVLPDP